MGNFRYLDSYLKRLVTQGPAGCGWTGAMGTYVAIDPNEKCSVVYMHNLQPNMEMQVHSRVRNIAFGALR